MEENQNIIPVQNPVPEQPPVTPLPPADGPKPKFPFVLIIGIILFLLVAGSVAGFYVFKQNSLKMISKPIATQTVQKLTPSPISDPTANWKTYTGDGFTFKYPESFDNANCPQNFGISALCSAKQDTGPEPLIYYISASKETVLPNQYKYLASTINDLQVFKTTDALSRSGAESVYIKKSDNSYVYIFFTPYDQQKPFPNQEKFYAIFNQILSTFKFTDSQTIDTSNWKTYVGKGYEFKYPTEATIKSDTNGSTQTTVDLIVNGVSIRFEELLSDGQVPPFRKTTLSKVINDISWNEDTTSEEFCDGGQCGKTKMSYYLYKNGNVYSFYFDNNRTQPVVTQILSTFKFTN